MLAAAVAGVVWVVAAIQGYALEMIWLPGVAVGAAWPRRTRPRTCLARRSKEPR